MSRRCTNCGKYPFCLNMSLEPQFSVCGDWIKQKLGGVICKQQEKQVQTKKRK